MSSEPAPTTLDGGRVILRRVRESDRAWLEAALAEPSIHRWWGTEDPATAAATLLAEEDHLGFLVERDGRPVGYIQCSEETEPDYRHASIDLFVATAAQGQGVGPAALRTLLRWLFDARRHHRVTIDPALGNVRAIGVYRRVGFRPVGVMRRYERGPDGTWHDGLLMDMLAGELA